MEIIRIPKVMQETSRKFLREVKTIGFVPTMGALHEGHLSLVRRAKQDNHVAVVSIFVNPIQFGPTEDFERYPRDIEGDIEKLRKEDVDTIFMPDVSSMYPEGFSTYVEVVDISERLCGAFRPGHFKGVTTVVTKLLNIVKPKILYLGQKDYQQSVVIKRLLKDLDMDVDIVVCPTIREKDGLAMSSRNMYLDNEQRNAARIIYRCLIEASEIIKAGIKDGVYIKNIMFKKLKEEPLVSTIDYAGVYDPDTLVEINEIKKEILLAIALRIGNTRLIDNILLEINT
ncbi:MAG: pantoate--beta-alanine ligase [Nitrospirae bacterium]|nr:pantoate--beta-alanine ligase [Nitrospirota bacterium]